MFSKTSFLQTRCSGAVGYMSVSH